jgi:hypothetical protein
MLPHCFGSRAPLRAITSQTGTEQALSAILNPPPSILSIYCLAALCPSVVKILCTSRASAVRKNFKNRPFLFPGNKTFLVARSECGQFFET